MSFYKCQESKIKNIVKLGIVNFVLQVISIDNGFHLQI